MNAFRAGAGGPTGGNQTQGKGEIPGKVSVPMPGTNTTQAPCKSHGKPAAISGFTGGGVIPGKV